jgi:HSP20 family molecular chaperone IbpA
MATVVRWEPLRDVAALQSEMGRMMNSLFGATGNGEGRPWVPPVDAWETDKAYRYERRFGSFSRTIGLPQGVSEKDVKADYKDGVLEVRVAKPEAPKPRRIQIGRGGKATIEGSAKKA